MIVVSCAASTGCLGATSAATTGTYYYLLKYYPQATAKQPQIPEMTGSDLVLSGTRADFGPTGGPIVTLQFTNHGSSQFQKITKDEAQRGATKWALAGKPAISAHEQSLRAALRDRARRPARSRRRTSTSSRTPTASRARTPRSTSARAARSARRRTSRSCCRPVRCRSASSRSSAPTSRRRSARARSQQAWHAALIGLLIVALFLLVLYRFLGLVAVVGLAIYASLYYAAILLFHVTLTLPGFAGLILTIGVAADANVVVFERIKEEVRAGKSVRAAIAAGYGKGFHTILDANVVTAITALVLFLVAIASVKGFALMLLIGTMISLLTAVAATRALLHLLSGFRWFDNPRFMGAQGQQTAKWLQIDFMKRRKLWFAMSGLIIIAGAVSLGVRGLNLGIDFKGGAQITLQHAQGATRRPRSATSRRKWDRRTRSSRAAARRRTGSTRAGRSGRARSSGRVQSTFQQDLERQVGAYKLGTTNVSSSFGHQIAIDAIWGIIVSMFLIVIYIAIRFSFKFALPVIIAMLHDIIITVGVYSIAFKEVSVATVAAVLTVLGYSIYDTIIIFDRVRENIPLMRKQSMATITNVSLWETIRRSLATTFITLLPIIALEILGGSTLKDFAFALIVGVTSGAYSSIFIAAPLLTIVEGARAGVRAAQGARRRDRRHARGRRRPPRTARRRRHGCARRVRGRARRGADAGARRRRSRRRRPSQARRHAARSAGSAGARGRMAAPGSGRLADALGELLAELPERMRGGQAKLSEQALAALRTFAEQLNLVSRDEVDELELRVAQLEHRLRLLERSDPPL